MNFHKEFEPGCEEIAEVNKKTDLVLAQRTPVRVLHRRTSMLREKVIHRIHIHQINRKFGLCFLLTSAGTYVKEFIHSDLGRTTPNLRTLLKSEADIL